MVIVYFENDTYSEVVAIFNTEELYLKCLASLQEEAESLGMRLTESIEDFKMQKLNIFYDKQRTLF